MAPKAYSYLRFSTPEQMKGDSMRRQTTLAEEYCKAHGLTLDTELSFQDLGVSAFRGKNSETGRLAEFLQLVEAGRVERGSFLLVESLDRVSRQAARKALRVLEEIVEAGITVVTLTDGKQYTAENLTKDPMSLIMALLIFIRANEESQMKSQRIRQAWHGKRLKAAQGRPLSSKGPHWLKLDKESGKWEVIEERAQHVRRIFELAAEGLGYQMIAKRLNAEGRAAVGKFWHASYVGKLLEDPSVIGTFVPKVIEMKPGGGRRRIPQEPVEGYFPAIIDRDLWDRVRAVRSSPSPNRGRSYALFNIFSGLLRCGRCGAAMNRVIKNKTRYYVACVRARNGIGCSYSSIRYSTLEERFLLDHEAVLSLSPKGDDVELKERLEFLASTISRVNEEREAAAEGYSKTRDQALLRLLTRLNADLDVLRAEEKALIERIEATSGPLVAKRVAALQELLVPPLRERQTINAIMRTLFTGISLNPDTGVATFAWKHGGESQLVFGFPKDPPGRRQQRRVA